MYHMYLYNKHMKSRLSFHFFPSPLPPHSQIPFSAPGRFVQELTAHISSLERELQQARKTIALRDSTITWLERQREVCLDGVELDCG